MNITFLIGNGFDLGLGLASDYKSFYPYFIENANKDNIIRHEIEKAGKDNYVNWSDLESALGRFTAKITYDNADQFVRDKVELDELLKRYLLSQEENFVCSDQEIEKMVKKVLDHLRTGNSIEERERIQQSLNAYLDEDYFYQAISFNYTECADKIWQYMAKKDVGHHSFRGDKHNERFDSILHIHGTLKDNEMLLGVNDADQVSNCELLDKEAIRWSLVKPYLNKAIGQRKIEKAQALIDRSGIICLYGVSIGITDNMWWEYIGEWLKKYDTHLLIIYNHDSEYQDNHPVNRLIHMEKTKNSFLEKTKLGDNAKKNVISRIIVYDNQDIFSLN